MSREINELGLDLVKHFESLFLRAYQDSVGVWTIGWGHTGLVHQDGTVFAGRTITEAEAANLLKYDMHQSEQAVEALVAVPINDDQFSALVSFHFNVGALRTSTLLRLLNTKDYWGAANQFERWNKAGGQELRGLTRRRRSERNLFCSFPNPIVLSI